MDDTLHDCALETLGEDALLLRFGDAIDVATNARAHALARELQQARPAWLLDVVPAHASLALFVDVDAFDCTHEPLVEATRWLRGHTLAAAGLEACARVVEIPVDYGGEDGPDLDDVATHAGLSHGEVIARHCAVEYRVAMLGFAPGFPYLIGLDPQLAMPRLATPRTHVAAGSVGIGGAQTGIYPHAGPGGWRIIGRTPRVLFDPAQDPPTLLAPGDRVRFIATTGGT